jgi:deoxyribodipyrimidine photolyase-related protein
MSKPKHAARTVWILGDQLDAEHPGLRDAQPANTRVLMIECVALLSSQRWHRQRVHLVLSAMRHYAQALRERGFEVDYRCAPSFRAGLAAHRNQYAPQSVVCAEPTSHALRRLLPELHVRSLRHERFMCHESQFSDWAKRQRGLRMDAFYRMRRHETGYLMQRDKPIGGAFSFDTENREPASRAPEHWPRPLHEPLDQLDRETLRDLPSNVFGSEPDGTWATTRSGALQRLKHFIKHVLPGFGPHQDVMLAHSWHLSHSLLSPYLNLGLLHAREVCEAIVSAYEKGAVPIASAEGCLRQILGWREYVWGSYWWFGPEYADQNALQAERPLLPLYKDPERTRMQCMKDALHSIDRHAYAHHIQRLMLLGNLALLTGVRPIELSHYMQASFIDSGEWVMWPNVIGMATYADGGRMMTKPYAAGGAYIHRMSDACGRCVYRPALRVGEQACPFTSLYWSFFARHRERFADHPRVRNMVRGLDRLKDRSETLKHAEKLLVGLSEGNV